jgi:hypothetical protein
MPKRPLATRKEISSAVHRGYDELAFALDGLNEREVRGKEPPTVNDSRLRNALDDVVWILDSLKEW